MTVQAKWLTLLLPIYSIGISYGPQEQAMRQEELVQQVTNLKDSLKDIEKQLAGGIVPLPVLEDFKAAVDHTRLTVWALMSSAKADPSELAALLVRFRLRRAADMCRQIRTDISGGEVTPATPELPLFHTAVRDLLDQISRLHKPGP